MYTSPETLMRNCVSKESDVWQIGLAALEMFTGRPAFEKLTLEELR